MPEVNPEILVWARETAGLDIGAAAQKLGFRDSGVSSAAEKLAALEAGHKEPSRPQLVKMAEQYRRPLLTFYLSRPPRKGDRGTDFRTLSPDISPREEALLDALVREVRARQSMVRAVIEEEDEVEPLPFIGSLRIEDGRDAALATLRWLVGVELTVYYKQRNPKEAFDLLREHTEKTGVFVLLQGNLGSHHTDMDTEIFRGFSIADDRAPFVVINPNDARPALSYTLLHELVHLLLGQTGVSAARAENDIEQFCDRVAGEFLLPEKELPRLPVNGNANLAAISERISEFAGARNLSRTMVAYNAYLANRISGDTFRKLRDDFGREWRQERERYRAQAREREAKIDPNVTRRYQLGNALIHLVRRMTAAGELTTVKAATVLGVKPGRLQTLLDANRRVRG